MWILLISSLDMSLALVNVVVGLPVSSENLWEKLRAQVLHNCLPKILGIVLYIVYYLHQLLEADEVSGIMADQGWSSETVTTVFVFSFSFSLYLVLFVTQLPLCNLVELSWSSGLFPVATEMSQCSSVLNHACTGNSILFRTLHGDCSLSVLSQKS
jgi:hypothetical protein